MKIYMHLVKSEKALGVREIARILKLPPSTVHYHLKRLEELGLVQKEGGDYKVKEVVKPEEFVVIGKMFIPRLTVYSLFFLGICIGLTIIMVINGINIDRILTLLTSTIAFILLFIEGLNHMRKYQE